MKAKKSVNAGLIAPPPPLESIIEDEEELARQKPKSSKNKYNTVNNCKSIIENFVSHISNLKKQLSNVPPKKDYSPLWEIADYQLDKCKNYKSSIATLKKISDAVNFHRGKIGIILPLSNHPQQVYFQAILSGIEASMGQFKQKFQDFFIVKDSKNNPKDFTRAYAELLLEESVSMIIGGFDKNEANSLNNYSKLFFIPTLLINGNPNLELHKYKYQIYPRQEHLASALVNTLKNRSIKTVSVFQPLNRNNGSFLVSLKKELADNQIEMMPPIEYLPGNFDSMEQAVKKLANIDYISRKEEFDEAYKLAEEEAKQKNFTFNPRTVILPAQLNSEAVIIPDDFRIVKHFAKLFQYHKIEKILMLGNHEWRSEGLISPWEPYLQGSLFVDFIGSYKQFPNSLNIEIGSSPYFIRPEKVDETDLKLIGYRTGNIALRALTTPQKRRRDIAENIRTMKSKNGFYQNEFIFDEKHFSDWPTYVFTVSNKEIVLLNNIK